MSVYIGSWSVDTQGDSSVGSLKLSSMAANISGNTITNCRALRTGIFSSFGANVYGGGISVAVGAYSYSGSSSSSVSGNTTVSNTSYAISSNTLTNCFVLSKTSGTSNGASAYGGAFSVVHGVALFPSSSGSFVQAIGVSSVLRVYNCSFSACKSTRV